MKRHAFVCTLLVAFSSLLCLTVSAGKCLANDDFYCVPPSSGGGGGAPGGTTSLYFAKFEVGATCSTAGWTTVDLTAQTGTYFHVDDYALLNPVDFYPLSGTKSLWCGARPAPDGPCGYQTLPGYGNNWNQAWCTKNCIAVAGGLDVAFLMRVDTEPGHDVTTLEYTTNCPSGASGWMELERWDGNTTVDLSAGVNYLDVPDGLAKVRLHFQSDRACSDEDGFWPSHGAIHVDNLQVEGLALEDFEGEALDATSSNDWTSCNPPGFGNHLALFPGSAQVQEDPCAKDLLCLWAAILAPTGNYACGGFLSQPAVPRHNSEGQYLANEIWSPNIPLGGTGTVVNLEFSVYRDNPLNNLVFYTWHIRTVYASGCPGDWKSLNFAYYGGKDWLRQVESVGAFLDLTPGNSIQIALGVVDQGRVWAGIYGDGLCHSHAPLLDTVRLYRVAKYGPQWSIRDIDQFQDNFSDDGTETGTVRADMAKDILPETDPNIEPGDFAVVTVADPVNGLAIHSLPQGRSAVYLWVAVNADKFPAGEPLKSGADLGSVRFPFVRTQVANSVTWTILLLDQVVENGSPVADRFCVDLPDNLFTPGDVISFFYSANSNEPTLTETFAFGSNLGATGMSADEAAANAAEFTCLPARGWQHGGDILYVDGMDGRGAQPYWDSAFQQLGILDEVDRYDIRGPSSSVNNNLASRVRTVVQLLERYRKILWDCGDLSITLGAGFSGGIPKTDDYGLLNDFLDYLPLPGGVYLCGDDVAEVLNGLWGPSAIIFRSMHMTYTLTNGNHRLLAYGMNPGGIPYSASCFSDAIVIFGGCPLVNDFDVMAPTGSTTIELNYGAAGAFNGAVLGNAKTNLLGVNVGVLLSGFAFEYIRADDFLPPDDRALHLHDIITWLGDAVPQPTPVAATHVNSLSQNYPNPFNPQTTIAFSLKNRALVSLKVYNVAGELVRTLVNEERAAGHHNKEWDGRDNTGQEVSSGVYFYKLVASDFSLTKKMILLK